MNSPPQAVVEGVCLFYSDYYAMTPNPKDKDEKQKQLLHPTNPYVRKAKKPL